MARGEQPVESFVVKPAPCVLGTLDPSVFRVQLGERLGDELVGDLVQGCRAEGGARDPCGVAPISELGLKMVRSHV
jgi:hypothetical protein